MGILKTTGHRVGIAGELFSFFWSNKRWWLVPMIVTLFLLGALIVLAVYQQFCIYQIHREARKKENCSRL